MSEVRQIPSVALVSIFRESIIGGIAVHSSSLYDRLADNGVEVYKVNYAKVFMQNTLWKKLWQGLALGRKLLSARLKGVKLFHFHASNQAIVFYIFGPLIYLTGATVFLSIHSGYGFDKWLAEHPNYDRVNRIVFRVISRLIFMNPEESSRIAERYEFLLERILTINPYIAPPPKQIPPVKDRPSVGECFKIVTIGAWTSRYNVEEALAAALSLSQMIKDDVHLTIVQSTASAEQEYQRELREKIRAAGQQISIEVIEDSSDILEILVDHDVFIRPAKGDSYGLCVAESLLVGTPAIATDLCRRCEGTLLYQQGDMEKLREHLLSVYQTSRSGRATLLHPSQDSYHGYIEAYASVE